MSKAVKNMVIDEIRERVGDAQDFLLINVSRLNGVTANKFRLAMQKQKIRTLSVRNTLVRKALGDRGLDSLDQQLSGPTTIVWGGEDIVALSKEMAKWAKDLKELEIKGGTTEGTALTPADVESLSKSPSREELIGQIVGLILSPGGRVAGALLGSGGKIAGALKTISDKEGGEAAA